MIFEKFTFQTDSNISIHFSLNVFVPKKNYTNNIEKICSKQKMIFKINPL